MSDIINQTIIGKDIKIENIKGKISNVNTIKGKISNDNIVKGKIDLGIISDITKTDEYPECVMLSNKILGINNL
jgi:hypothetical protein